MSVVYANTEISSHVKYKGKGNISVPRPHYMTLKNMRQRILIPMHSHPWYSEHVNGMPPDS
jgi:hypothetical protein